MQISKAISKSGKKIIKVIKKLSPHARLARKLEHERQTTQRNGSIRKNEKISTSWWALESKPKDDIVVYEQCYCCCCQFADEENLRNENLENEMLRC